MALDYSLNIKNKHLFSKKLDDYLVSRGFLFEKEYGEKLVTFDLFKTLGFIISIFVSENAYFEYLSNKNQIIEKEWDHCSRFFFRLDKNYDHVNVRIHMLDIVTFIINQTTDDALLLFNGDVMILEKINGEIILNNDIGFWNLELSKKISLL